MSAAHRASIISYRFLNDLTRTRRLMGSIRNRTNFVSKTHIHTHIILRSVYNIIYRILYHISIEEALYRRRVQCAQRRKLFFFYFLFRNIRSSLDRGPTNFWVPISWKHCTFQGMRNLIIRVRVNDFFFCV